MNTIHGFLRAVKEVGGDPKECGEELLKGLKENFSAGGSLKEFSSYYRKDPYSDWLGFAFDWGETEKGFVYWGDIAKKLIEKENSE